MRCVMMPMVVLFVCPSDCCASLCSGVVVHGVLHNFKSVMMLEGLSAGPVCCIFIKCVVFCSCDRQVHGWFCLVFCFFNCFIFFQVRFYLESVVDV